MTELTLNGDYEVRAYDRDDNLAQVTIVEETGDIVIEDVFQNAVLHRLDRIEITTLAVRLKDEDDVIEEIQTDVEPSEEVKFDE